MSVEFNAETGQVSLDRVTFDALLAMGAGVDPPAKGLAQARESGLVSGASIHPEVRPAIGAAADPVAIGRLEMQNEQGSLIVSECWVAREAATYLVGTPGDQLELVATPPSHFPISVARLVGLSPRSRTPFQPWRMPVEMVDDVFSDDEARRGEAAATIANTTDDPDARAYTEALAKGPWWFWTLEVHWPGQPDGEGARSLHIVDTPRGMAIMSLSDELIAVDPTNPTEVFQLLTAILPRDDELAFT
ncbi:MAG: hypothetical protein ACRDO7_09120 [Nocardioidaceae bacterium]